MPPAELIFDDKELLEDGSIIQMRIGRVPEAALPSMHMFKYSLLGRLRIHVKIGHKPPGVPMDTSSSKVRLFGRQVWIPYFIGNTFVCSGYRRDHYWTR